MKWKINRRRRLIVTVTLLHRVAKIIAKEPKTLDLEKYSRYTRQFTRVSYAWLIVGIAEQSYQAAIEPTEPIIAGTTGDNYLVRRTNDSKVEIPIAPNLASCH